MPQLVHIGRLMGPGQGGPAAVLMGALSAAGIPAVSDLLYIVAGGSAQQGRVNRLNPGTNDLEAINSPTFTVNVGYSGDGLGAFLRTNKAMNACTFYTQNSASVCVAVTGSAPNSDRWAGAETGNANMFLGTSSGGDFAARLNSNSGGTVANAVPKGVYAINRTNSSNFQMYKNGAEVASVTVGTTALTSGFLTLLDNFGLFGIGPVGYGRFGAALTTGQIATEAAAVKTYLNTINPGLMP